jgi:hypothetical protein
MEKLAAEKGTDNLKLRIETARTIHDSPGRKTKAICQPGASNAVWRALRN